MTAEREAAEVLGALGWHVCVTDSEHDPGCPGDATYCTLHCPVPVQRWLTTEEVVTALAAALAAAAGTTREAEACVRGSVLTEAVDQALNDAEQAGMTGRTRAEWVSIALVADSRVPLTFHFPAEGGGPCPTCGERYETKGATDD